MGRLGRLQSRLTPLASGRLQVASTSQERDRVRDQRPYRKWYHTARWRALRWAVLVRDAFICGKCGDLVADTSKLVADHKQPHRGNARLFWDMTNLWTLCASCHSGAKQREEQAEW